MGHGWVAGGVRQEATSWLAPTQGSGQYLVILHHHVLLMPQQRLHQAQQQRHAHVVKGARDVSGDCTKRHKDS